MTTTIAPRTLALVQDLLTVVPDQDPAPVRKLTPEEIADANFRRTDHFGWSLAKGRELVQAREAALTDEQRARAADDADAERLETLAWYQAQKVRVAQALWLAGADKGGCLPDHLLAHPEHLTPEGKQWIRDIGADPYLRNVWVWGPMGTGKTDWAMAFGRFMADKGKRVYVLKFRDLADLHTERGMDAKRTEILTGAQEADVLIVDDYGVQGEWTQDLAKDLIAIVEARQTGEDRLTVWTANSAPVGGEPTDVMTAEMINMRQMKYGNAAGQEATAGVLTRFWNRLSADLLVCELRGTRWRTPGNRADRIRASEERCRWWAQERPTEWQAIKATGRLPHIPAGL